MARNSTTVNSSYVLLVEGEDDRGFFEQVCKSLQLNPAIKVAPPKDYQADYEETLRNGKQAALNLLEDLLVELLDEAAPTQRLAIIIIDADYEQENGLGYQKTIEQISERVAEYDFSLVTNQTGGLSFKHNDGVAEFGLWIMPNNLHDGMLEDFIKTCVKINEQPLFDHSVQVVDDVPDKKFKSHHYSKAQVNTWLAWQKPPGHGLYYSVSDKLLDNEHALFQDLTQWLKQIFI
jgi:hypothetical protein